MNVRQLLLLGNVQQGPYQRNLEIEASDPRTVTLVGYTSTEIPTITFLFEMGKFRCLCSLFLLLA